MKVVAVPVATAPEDVKEQGLPASTIVLDERSGGVKAIVNARCLTALRNAAGTFIRYTTFTSNSDGGNELLRLRAFCGNHVPYFAKI